MQIITFYEEAREKMHKADLILSAKTHISEALKMLDLAEKIEPSRGDWFDKGSMSCRCSNCGCKANKEYSFCPNCGADMRGRKDG